MSRVYARYAWAVLAVMLGVILWGAYVRASGAGAGCGSHWPLCNGQVLPRSAQVKTLVEFTHRVTSGLAFLLTVGLVIGAWRQYPAGHPVRRAAAGAMALMISESGIGAGLVLFEKVAHDQSTARVWWLCLHLVNTFFLLAALALTAWRAEMVPATGHRRVRATDPMALWLAIGIVGALVVGVTGAITALGDTLFPVGSLAEGMRQDFSPTAHLAVRLRILHPVFAVAVGLYLAVVATLASRRSGAAQPGRRLIVLVLAQLAVGAANLLLLAPVALQLTHLLLADLVWIALVLLAASVRTEPAADPVEAPAAVAALGRS